MFLVGPPLFRLLIAVGAGLLSVGVAPTAVVCLYASVAWRSYLICLRTFPDSGLKLRAY
jgi:hypothetical protein